MLAGMSTDYYIELEQGRGPRPSEQILTSLASALDFNPDECTYLFRLAGYAPPTASVVPGFPRVPAIHPSLRDLFGRLTAIPTLVITDLHELLAQNALAVALLGVRPTGTWPDGSFAHRWFAEPAIRVIFPEEDHAWHSQILANDLRASLARRGNDPAIAKLMIDLCTVSAEFATLWHSHDVARRRSEQKRIVHPEHGIIEVMCHNLPTEDGRQRLSWFSPVPGTAADRQFSALRASVA
ncbi:hypothetical protein GCM10027176_69910 [Actinoallomurus bryophytorum]